MLAAWVEQNADAPPGFFEAVDRRRAELQAEAFELGARVYAEKPKAFVERMRRLWTAREAAVPTRERSNS